MPSGYTDRKWKGDLCGAYEIAAWAQVTKGQVAHWAKEPWFPPTVDEPQMGRIWRFKEVQAVLSERGYPKADKSASKNPPSRKKKQPEAQDVTEIDTAGTVRVRRRVRDVQRPA